MVKEIEKEQIIPNLKGFYELSLCPEDVLVIIFDREKYDISQAQAAQRLLQHFFPNNDVIGMLDGVELGVIKHGK